MHTTLDIIRRLHEHRRWFRSKMIDAARALTVEEMRHPFPMGPGCVFGLLVHCQFAETAWISAIDGSDPAVVAKGAEAFPALDALLEHWKETDARWDRFWATLVPSDLSRPVVRIREGKAYTTSLEDVLIHVCTHQMYHAAQFKNMLRSLGKADLPLSDYIVFARENWSA